MEWQGVRLGKKWLFVVERLDGGIMKLRLRREL